MTSALLAIMFLVVVFAVPGLGEGEALGHWRVAVVLLAWLASGAWLGRLGVIAAAASVGMLLAVFAVDGILDPQPAGLGGPSDGSMAGFLLIAASAVAAIGWAGRSLARFRPW